MKMLTTIGAVAAFWPAWKWYLLRITDGSDEPWGILALLAAVFFLFRDRHRFCPAPGEMVGAALVILCYTVTYSYLPPLLRAILALLALGLFSGVLRRGFPVFVLLMLSLPLVASLQFYLGYPMRIGAAGLTQFVVALFGGEISRHGTDLVFRGETVGVDPPCGGIDMLWSGLFLIALAGAWQCWSSRQSLFSLLVTVPAIIVANALRVLLLFFKESEMLALPEWTHQGIGLAVFVLLLMGLNRLFAQVQMNDEENPLTSQLISRPLMIVVVLVLLGAGVVPLTSAGTRQIPANQADFPGWPEKWGDDYLEPVPLSVAESSFARDFPGKIGVFTAGGDRLVMRWVTRPTRKLHSSADCLRASGYEIEKERTGRFLAFSSGGGEQGWYVEEEIREENGPVFYKEASEWFWQASLGKTTGPWWAVTRIRALSL
jgi:exosortase/archaeosortase family protein